MQLPGVTPFPAAFAERYRARGYWDDRSLIQHYFDAFAAFGDRVAVIDENESLTYAELAARAERVARVLVDLGLKPRDRVVVQLPNTALFASLYLALFCTSGPSRSWRCPRTGIERSSSSCGCPAPSRSRRQPPPRTPTSSTSSLA